MRQNDVAAIVPAAGYSSRMGSFKPLLDLDGKPVISRIVDSLRSAGIDDVTVVAGYNRELLLPVLEKLPVRVVINDRFAEGMFSSVQAGVGSLEPQVKAFFLLPADVPLVRPQTLLYLLDKANRHAGKILKPCFMDKKGHPPLISARFIGDILRYSGGDGLKGVFSALAHNIVQVPLADENILFDMDTPGGYAELLERWKRRRVPSPAECRAIYAMLDVDERILRHSRVVADTAGNMANDLNRAGCNLDKDLIVAAALLHDIARERPDHAHQGARLVAELGFPEAGELISTHIDIPAHPNGEVNAAEVLYLADKLVQEDKKVSLEKRFGSKLAVHMDDARAVNKIISRSSTAFYIESRVAALIQGRINAPVSGKK